MGAGTPANGKGGFRRTVANAARDTRAAELHGQGWTYQRIADELGLASRGKACEAVQRAFADIPMDGAQEAKQHDLDRIDRLIEQAWQVMLRPHVTVSNGRVFEDILDDGPVLAAIGQLRSLLERRARIFGYDAPTRSRVEVVTADMIESQIADLEAQLAANDPADTSAS